MTFEMFLRADQAGPGQRRRIPYAVSLALHGALLLFGVAASFGRVEELTAPDRTVVTLMPFLPPPPPPPPGARASPRRSRPRPTQVVQPKPQAVVQPFEAPRQKPDPDSGPETGSPGGMPGGLPGGIPSGTEGPSGPPTFVPPSVARGRLDIDPQSDRYRVRLPPAMASARITVSVLVKICVKADGRVASVTILTGANPALDGDVVRVLSTWRYRPYTVDGRPVPFCTNVLYQIALT